jgi:predicted nucleic acid-binding protein
MIIALDSNIIIYVLDSASPFSKPAQLLLKKIEGSESQVFLSTVARTEILHQPYQVSVVIGEKAKQLLSSFGFITFVEVSVDIADKAAELCAKVGAKLKNIDAIHLATALSVGATEFWTNDRELLKVKVGEISIKSLDDVS